MVFVRKMMTAGATLLLGYAMKKLMTRVEAQLKNQSDAMRTKSEEARHPSEFKQLKLDPKTGEYYAED